MIDISKQIDAQIAVLEDLEKVRESVAELEIERPTNRLIEALLFNLDRSQTPQRIEDHIVVALEEIDMTGFWELWEVVESYRPTVDPRKQFVEFSKAMKIEGFKLLI